VLLLLPFVGLLWVPFYNCNWPRLFGFPFFYWYQLAWVPVTAVLTGAVHRVQGRWCGAGCGVQCWPWGDPPGLIGPGLTVDLPAVARH